jgi:hypothetical protein
MDGRIVLCDPVFFFELGTLSKPMMHLFEHNIRKNMVCSKDAMLKKTTVLNE